MNEIKTFSEPFTFLQKIILIGCQNNVSDIHINPKKDNVIINMRVADTLHTYCKIEKNDYNKFFNFIKDKAGIKYEPKEYNPKIGKIKLKLKFKGKDININLRISVITSIFGENIVIRILVDDENLLNIEKLGYINEDYEKIKSIKSFRNGLVLVSGETGSGKTTTLYSILNMFNTSKKSIYTIEDPVEYENDSFVQSELNSNNSDEEDKQALNKWIKGILRQDSDLIMISELKEKESSSICLQAANTGHLVFAGIHSNSGIGVINRLKQLGIESYLISSGLKMIIFQKIVKKLCNKCKVELDISNNSELKQDFDLLNNKNNPGGVIISGDKIYNANEKGCEFCKNGYSGLTLITEVIEIDDKLSQMIFENKSINDIKNHIIQTNNKLIYNDALVKAKNGIIDFSSLIQIKQESMF
ncbi:GspE/PulE family protein [Candidatus Vampirococcus lugosii]|uniref:Type II secretion system protein E n=1 Tax=Candidatus Vampirococcus lugosii TaxID=2789015 RepID=A0ABS5QMX1_9BACT|nr:ATPase, T2SS/T4P/T4SS family [Candidatus Vampirococcus lugosii]MBS8122550.1 type II secretion system protein E [Candidatus Vampirococcus lugosii]